MTTDPLLIELWIVALCAITNATPARIHADIAEAIVRWRRSRRPKA